LYINLQIFLDLKIGRSKNIFESNTISEIAKYLLNIWCTKFKDCKDLVIIRDLAMILLSFADFLRCDEISSLMCNNVKIYDEYLILFIEKAKTDQYDIHEHSVSCHP
jgi:integrase